MNNTRAGTDSSIVQTVVRVSGLTLLLFALFSVDFLGLSIVFDVDVAVYALTLALFDTVAVNYTIRRSSGRWKLAGSVFLIFYGVRTLLTQVETLVFVPELTGIVTRVVFNDALAIGVFTLVSVYAHGKHRPGGEESGDGRLVMPMSQWLWKPALLAALYVFVYIIFGLFVFRPIAGFLDPEALSAYIDFETPSWILQFQFVRGLFFVVFALPTIRLMRGSWRKAGLAVALLYSMIMGGNLLIPVESMPTPIRFAHFIEVFLENFLFGWLVVWVMRARSRWARL